MGLVTMYSARQVSGTVSLSGTTLITFDIEVMFVIFDHNSVVYIQMYLLNQFCEFLTSLKVLLRGVPRDFVDACHLPVVHCTVEVKCEKWMGQSTEVGQLHDNLLLGFIIVQGSRQCCINKINFTNFQQI